MGWSSLGTNEVITKAEIEVLQCSIKLISKGSSGKLPKDITNTSFIHIIGHTDTKGYGWGTFILNTVITAGIASCNGYVSFGEQSGSIWLTLINDSITVVETQNYDIATYPLNIDFIICYYW